MEPVSISFYDSTGRINATVTADPATIQMTRERATEPFVEGDYYGQDVYVAGGSVTPRLPSPAVLVGTMLRGLPRPCTIHVNDKPYPCLDTTAELGFSQPGTYRVRVEAWPYLDKEFTIENPA